MARREIKLSAVESCQYGNGYGIRVYRELAPGEQLRCGGPKPSTVTRRELCFCVRSDASQP